MWETLKDLLFEREDVAGSALRICQVVGAIIGLVLVEHAYFTSAEEVRLLFVLLLAPVGAAIGGIVGTFIAMLVPLGAITAIIFLVGAIIYGVIWALYSVVVWTN